MLTNYDLYHLTRAYVLEPYVFNMYLRLRHRNLVRGAMASVPHLSGNLYVFLIRHTPNLNSSRKQASTLEWKIWRKD